MGTVITLRPNALAEELRDIARRFELGTIERIILAYEDEDGELQSSVVAEDRDGWGHVYRMYHWLQYSLDKGYECDQISEDEDADED